MTHAEALYAYNTYICMGDFMDKMAIALSVDCLDVEEVPQLMEIHYKTTDKALKACHEYGWSEFAGIIEKEMREQDHTITRIRAGLEQWKRQKQR